MTIKLKTDGKNYSLATIDDNGDESTVQMPWSDIEPQLEQLVTPPVLAYAKRLVSQHFPIIFRM
jgi:hypothetical protein